MNTEVFVAVSDILNADNVIECVVSHDLFVLFPW